MASKVVSLASSKTSTFGPNFTLKLTVLDSKSKIPIRTLSLELEPLPAGLSWEAPLLASFVELRSWARREGLLKEESA